MTSVTVELPETLSQAIQQHRVPRQRLEGAVISFLEFFVRELDQQATAPLCTAMERWRRLRSPCDWQQP